MMIKKITILAFLGIGSILLQNCQTAKDIKHGVKHGIFMKGNIVYKNKNTVDICIGSEDRAEVGQVLTVFETIRLPKTNKKSGKSPYRRVESGKIKITEIFDEHYASALIVSGRADKGDIVALE